MAQNWIFAIQSLGISTAITASIAFLSITTLKTKYDATSIRELVHNIKVQHSLSPSMSDEDSERELVDLFTALDQLDPNQAVDTTMK